MDDDGDWSDEVSDNLTIIGTENILPIANITSITPNPVNETEKVTFTGEGSDEDGEVVWYYWHSSIDGELYEGNQSSFFTRDLSKGNHTIKFKVRDDEGGTSDYVYAHLLVNMSENKAPNATIWEISPNPAETGWIVNFTGSGADADGEVVWYFWYSFIDGEAR